MKNMKAVKKKLITAALVFTAVVGGSTSAFALSQPTSVYDSIVKVKGNYSELAGATSRYNCLAYALGNTTSWVWPWGSSNPSSSQVDSYMSSRGYTGAAYSSSKTGMSIVSYGTSSSNITHFSKISSSSSSDAKWGSLERLRSNGWDPYKPAGPYGYAVRMYK